MVDHPLPPPARLPGQCAWLDQTHAGLMVMTPDHLIHFANDTLTRMVGAPPGGLVGRMGLSLVAAEDHELVREQVRRRMAGEPGQPYDIRCRRDDGSLFDARVCGRRINFDGQDADLITIIDITELKRALRQAEWHAGMLARTEALCRTGSFEIELPSGRIVASAGLADLAGRRDAAGTGSIDALPWLPAEEQALVAGLWRNAVPHEPFEFTHRMIDGQGRTLVILHRGMVTLGADGHSRGVATLQDITAQRDAERRIEELATFDEVTGLPNRAALLQLLPAAMSGARRETRRLTLLALDVPRIDELNDTLGFGASDALTMAIAASLRACCSDDETVAHLGGSEFAVLLGGVDGQAQGEAEVQQRACQIRAAVQAPQRIGGTEVRHTCVIGIAVFPDNSDSPTQLLECAQMARAGGPGIAFYQPEARARATRELGLQSALHGAIEREELLLQYQPQVDLGTGQVTGAEALLRWTTPEFGDVPPAELVRVAERSGQIGAIGAWILRQACRQAVAWRRAGLPPVRVNVNLSPAQLAHGGVMASLQAALAEPGADASCLGIELPESALLADLEHTTALLKQIKATGVQVAVDDFGTGMSSMSALRSLPIDMVKVDRSFVHDVTAAPAEVSVTRAIITMAHSLHMRVLAIGVESEGQASLLASNGCDAIQGYWFSPPLPAAGFEALLREGRRLPERFTTRLQRKRTLLLVDDEENIVSSLKRLFRRDGYHIVTAYSAAEGLQRLTEVDVDVIVSDQRMPGMTGVEFLRRAKDLYPDTVRMVLSGFTELQSIIDAVNEGAIYKFLTKPWDDARLRAHVAEAFLHKEMADENRRLTRQVDSANNDLAALNQRLEALLDQQREQSELLQASAGGVREMLDEIPASVVGVDTDGMIAYLNREALRMLPDAPALLGRLAADALPARLLGDVIDEQDGRPPGEPATVAIAGRGFHAMTRVLATSGAPRGRLVLLVPQPASALA
jgi:diguanylate cyclase (GGDEF)-like protein/PAS domain S-box-containing protein